MKWAMTRLLPNSVTGVAILKSNNRHARISLYRNDINVNIFKVIAFDTFLTFSETLAHMYTFSFLIPTLLKRETNISLPY